MEGIVIYFSFRGWLEGDGKEGRRRRGGSGYSQVGTKGMVVVSLQLKSHRNQKKEASLRLLYNPPVATPRFVDYTYVLCVRVCVCGPATFALFSFWGGMRCTVGPSRE